jgi:UDP-3-O-acyl-N-acetylglucosamine deacetylase
MHPSRTEILAGPGVHSGAPGRVELTLRDDADSAAAGPRFHLPGLPGPLPAVDLARLPRQARRATVLGKEGEGLRTPEHLLAALLFFGDCPLDVRFRGPEVPILDGSALPFREALARLVPARAARPAWREFPSGLAWEEAWADGHLRVRPAARFRAVYRLDRPPLRETCAVESPEQAWDEVLPARTFITTGEWRRATGPEGGGDLLRGATGETGLLLAETPEEHAALGAGPLGRGGPSGAAGPFPLVNRPAWRMPGEPARHKLLDLLGDLALLGLALPALDIEVRNGGHAAHLRLVERLAERRA